jgi:hypothetical protein
MYMLTESSVTGSDDWWLVRLGRELGEGLPRMGKLRRYRDGDAMVPEQAHERAKASYVSFARRQRLHTVETLRDARTTRQRVVGFRTAAAGDELGDTLAWEMWLRSNMEVASRDFLNDVADYGSAFLTTTGSPESGTGSFAGQFAEPSIVPSNGWTTASSQLGSRPWLTEAAIQVGYDPIGEVETILLSRPGYVRLAYRRTKVATLPSDGTPWNPGTTWEWATPPVPLNFTADCNVVRLDGTDRMGVWEKHIDTVDRINEITLNLVTLIVMQAFRQRALKGNLPDVYPADHPKAGEPIDYDELFKSGPDALWLLPLEAELWESAVTDVTPVVNARKEELKNLAAFSATPHYVLSPDNANQAAAGAALAREMLVFSVEAMNARASTAFRQSLALGFQAKRDLVRADPARIETIWADLERASIAEKGTAAKDAKQGGAPQRWIDEKVLGMTPAEQAQARLDRTEEAFTAALAGGGVGTSGGRAQ